MKKLLALGILVVLQQVIFAEGCGGCESNEYCCVVTGYCQELGTPCGDGTLTASLKADKIWQSQFERKDQDSSPRDQFESKSKPTAP